MNYVYATAQKSKDQRTICRNQVPPSATWIPRTKVSSSVGSNYFYLLSYLTGPSWYHFTCYLLNFTTF